MKKYLLGSLILIALLFVFVELLKDETFTVVEYDSDTLVWIESNKRLNPSYKRAILNIEIVKAENTLGDDIDSSELELGATIKAEIGSLALLSDPPVLNASKIILLE